jgi:hypothetical protein
MHPETIKQFFARIRDLTPKDQFGEMKKAISSDCVQSAPSVGGKRITNIYILDGKLMVEFDDENIGE